MSEARKDLLRMAQQSVAAVRTLLENGYPGFAAARAYYAMFYVAEMFLDALDLSFSSHSAVIAEFGRRVAKTGAVPMGFHRALIEAQEIRSRGDYGAFDDVPVEEAEAQIRAAEEFIQAALQKFPQ